MVRYSECAFVLFLFYSPLRLALGGDSVSLGASGLPRSRLRFASLQKLQSARRAFKGFSCHGAYSRLQQCWSDEVQGTWVRMHNKNAKRRHSLSLLYQICALQRHVLSHSLQICSLQLESIVIDLRFITACTESVVTDLPFIY